MAGAAVENGAEKGVANVAGTAVFSYEHTAFAVLGEEIVQSVDIAREKEVSVEAGGREMILIGGEDGVRALEHRRADGNERTLGTQGVSSDKERFQF